MRRLPLFLIVLAACSSQPTTPVTTPPLPTEPASTTTAPFFLEGAPPGWERAVADLYGAVCGGDRARIPDNLAALPELETCPMGGRAAFSVVEETTLAVAVLGEDAIYGVDAGEGFSIVAARVPSLGLDPGWYGTLPKIVAVAGSDARPGEDVASSRADSLHLIGLDGAGAGGLVGIPRDSWVPIDGGSLNKINAALALGGPETMLATLAEVSELTIDGIVLTGFEGFVEMWGNVLGGAEVEVPLAIQDRAAKADLEAGRQLLDGTQALAFSRTRKTLAGGDLTRQFHGGLVLLAALEAVQSRGPLHVPQLMADSHPWLVTNLTWDELLAWSALAMDTPVEAIGNVVVPARIGTVGSASVVFLTDEAPAVFADLADGVIAP